MSRRARIVMGACALVASGTLAWWLVDTPPSAELTPAPWLPDGTSATYDVHYRAFHGGQSLGTETPGALLGGNLDLRARVRLTDLGATELGGDGRQPVRAVALELVGVDTAALSLLGRDVFTEELAEQTLLRHQLVATLRGGELDQLAYSADASPLFRHLARALLLEMQISSSGVADGSTILERTPRGVAPTHYVETSTGWSKVRDTYASVDALALGVTPDTILADGLFDLELDATGLVSLSGRETVLAETANAPVLSLFAEIDLHRIGMADEPGAKQLAGQRWWHEGHRYRPVATLEPSAGARASALRLQAAGMTGSALLEQVVLLDRGGVIANQSEWFWRATGLLELEPDLARELQRLFVAPSASSTGRMLIADLLVAAGTEPAQRALVDALSSPVVRSDPAYARLLVRPALLRAPSAEVVAFLHDELGLETGRGAQAAALALGAVVGASEAETTDVEAAHESLRRRLEAAPEPEQRALYLRALGNAGDAEDLPVVADYAGSSEVEVRMAAAKAMRKLRDPNSETLLYELFGDTSERVQSAALLALAERPLSEPRLEDLRRLVVAGRVADANLDALVNLLVRKQARHPLTREIFTQILANDPRRPELAARLRVLLEEF